MTPSPPLQDSLPLLAQHFHHPRPAFGCFGVLKNSDVVFDVTILCSLHLRSHESLYIIKAGVTGKSSDIAEAEPVLADTIAEAALAHRSGVDHDRAVMAVTGLFHPFEQISVVAELYIVAGRAPHHAEGTVIHEYRPRIGLRRAVNVHGTHDVAVSPRKRAADELIGEGVAPIPGRFQAFHFDYAEEDIS